MPPPLHKPRFTPGLFFDQPVESDFRNYVAKLLRVLGSFFPSLMQAIRWVLQPAFNWRISKAGELGFCYWSAGGLRAFPVQRVDNILRSLRGEI